VVPKHNDWQAMLFLPFVDFVRFIKPRVLFNIDFSEAYSIPKLIGNLLPQFLEIFALLLSGIVQLNHPDVF